MLPVPDLLKLPFKLNTLPALLVPDPKFTQLAVVLVTVIFPFTVTEPVEEVLAASKLRLPVPLMIKSLVVIVPTTLAAAVEPEITNEPLLTVVFPVTFNVPVPAAAVPLATLSVPPPLMVRFPSTVHVTAVAYGLMLTCSNPARVKSPATPKLKAEAGCQIVDAPPAKIKLLY